MPIRSCGSFIVARVRLGYWLHV